VTGTPEGPGRVGVSVCDIGAGQNAYAAVLEALLQRAITGRGSAIHVSLFDTVAEWMSVPLLLYEASGRLPERIGLHHVSIAPYGLFHCADGEVLLAIQNEREWVRLCTDVLDNSSLAADARFASNSARVANREELERIMRARFATMSRQALLAAMDAADIAYGAVNTVAELAQHPHLRRAATASPGGSVSVPLPPAANRDFRAGAVPEIGAHTEAVRREFNT
jgi:crotonobetainyl-CoA:carnitine CoA-transferase CaiB-like acyl-CoA transferase